jgi:L-threonylcarbamoyladenylate synthase
LGKIMTDIIRIDPANIDSGLISRAAERLRAGELVAFPTETVYGLGANALDETAMQSVYRAKGRPGDNPLIVHICDVGQLRELTASAPPAANALMERFWPGALTIVFQKHPDVPYFVTSGLDTIAIRMPSHPIARALIRAAGVPVAAPSANISGKPSPTLARHVIRDLAGKIAVIIDGDAFGQASRVEAYGAADGIIGLESTVVDVSGGRAAILRPGGVTREAIASAVMGPEGMAHETMASAVLEPEGMAQGAVGPAVGAERVPSGEVGGRDGLPPISPGTKYRHYAPSAKMLLLKGRRSLVAYWMNRIMERRVARAPIFGALASDELLGSLLYRENAISLGSGGKPEEAASRLFGALRRFDEMDVGEILCEYRDDGGLGAAISDRMKRAASGRLLDISHISGILFVCTGNTCRSCMAEAIFNAAAGRQRAAAAGSLPGGQADGFPVPPSAATPSPGAPSASPSASSAGVAALDGGRASADAVAALRAGWGIDLSGHRARSLTPGMLDGADLVLAMTKSHREHILKLRPDCYFKVFTLLRGGEDVPDPYGRGPDAYRECAAQLGGALAELRELLDGSPGA